MPIVLNGTTGITQPSVTGAFQLPAGTTAQRPGSPTAGMIRLNTTTGNPEWYDSFTGTWLNFTQSASYSVEFLVVAGGASGSNANGGGGGGGAGGYISSTSTLNGGQGYTITIGAGAAQIQTGQGNNGSNSSAFSNTAIGGGGGGANSVGSGIDDHNSLLGS